MLAADGGLVATQQQIEVGGQVLRRHGQWYFVLKVNMRNGVLSSVTVSGHFASTITADEIKDYRPPAPGDAEKVQAIAKIKPLCNYPGERFATMTSEQWKKTPNDYKTTGGRSVIVGNEQFLSHRVRVVLGCYATLPEPAGEELAPNYCTSNRSHRYWPVFISDAPIKNPPASDGKPKLELPQLVHETLQARVEKIVAADAMRAEAGADSVNVDTGELHFGDKISAMRQPSRPGCKWYQPRNCFPRPRN